MTRLCCCIPLKSSQRISSGHEKLDTSELNIVTHDIFGDEGAGYQRELWELVLSQKHTMVLEAISRAKISATVIPAAIIENKTDILTAENCLQRLTTLYKEDNSTQRMLRIRAIFTSIKPFTAAITTMSQTNMISALLWGSLSLVFEYMVQLGKLWEDMRIMLEDMSRRLPRFHAYHEVLHTPRLHSSLREVYGVLLDFYLKVLKSLEGNHLSIWFHWSSVSDELKLSVSQLVLANDEFEREVQLANVQHQWKRHEEIMAVLRPVCLATNIIVPRNEKFTGRDSILTLLHSILEPSFKGDLENRTLCSCLLHATGGMGKTEAALEYTYKFRNCYTYIFWLRSQTEELLLDSFFEIASVLNLVKEEGLTASKKVQICLQWFQSTDKPWLLVFDNAESIATLRPFWPASTRGAIMVTSQNPALSMITKDNIHLQPMTLDEGSSLIQSILHRGGSEKEEAQSLSEHLGGLPLAITHFAGAILRSQCPIGQISQSFLKRVQSSQIWEIDDDTSTSRGYENTLNTVWDFAIRRLSTDSITLLEYIAFIDPDRIPVDQFVGATTGRMDDINNTYWDSERFNQAISSLCERHLVERYQDDALDILRTHRALQQSILQRLDQNIPKRDSIFNEVVSIVRQALPVANLINRGNQQQMKPFAKYNPQAICLHKNFTQSEHINVSSLEFVTVLHDSAFYGRHWLGQLTVPLRLLETAEGICISTMAIKPEESNDMLVHILSTMGAIHAELGAQGRIKSLELMARVLHILEQKTQDIPPEKLDSDQIFLLARAYADYAWYLLQENQIEKAKELFDKTIDCLRLAGDEYELLITHAICNRLRALSAQQQKRRTRDEAVETLATIARLCGEYDLASVRVKFQVASAYFTIGDVDKALSMHEEVFKARSEIFGSTHHYTFASQYCLAVCLQHKKELEAAETHIREILAVGCMDDGWKQADVVRVQFRLSIVLCAQNRLGEAGKIRKEVDVSSFTTHPGATYTDEELMSLLDNDVTLNHGRTAGIWSNGVFW